MERFGFRFWLIWILWFAGSFLAASAFWTLALKWIFGQIQGHELALTWCVSVFGSWFLLMIPFMRKKEQIWKRINPDQERALDAWLPAMVLFLGLLISSAFIWSYIFRREILDPANAGFYRPWLKAVIATWLIVLLPFLVWMYKKADQIYKIATARQSARGPAFRTEFVEKSRRMLPPSIVRKVSVLPPALKEGHLLNLVLKDGRKVSHAFVLRSEILGVYDRMKFDFTGNDVADIEVVPADQIPVYEEAKWLRLDGRA